MPFEARVDFYHIGYSKIGVEKADEHELIVRKMSE
jgi:hypothetical protein